MTDNRPPDRSPIARSRPWEAGRRGQVWIARDLSRRRSLLHETAASGRVTRRASSDPAGFAQRLPAAQRFPGLHNESRTKEFADPGKTFYPRVYSDCALHCELLHRCYKGYSYNLIVDRSHEIRHYSERQGCG